MTLAILGAGRVGSALARALTAHGERVALGVPNPDKYAALAADLGTSARLGTVDEAVATARTVVLALPYEPALEVAAQRPDWDGRILIDVTNPIAPGLAGLSVGTTTSGAEQIAARARNARVVKAFNTTGAENVADSRYPRGEVFMPVCGDDAQARAEVIALAQLIGFDAADCGDLRAARYLEPFAMTWIHMALKLGHGRSFAFARLKR
ncbi:MAG TPA: NADPH-dependent F420 reductase [Burkholderiaceae bacterium]|nr:NADPH-dependent F420 reductase [Burkholderiaceae bacterium]